MGGEIQECCSDVIIMAGSQRAERKRGWRGAKRRGLEEETRGKKNEAVVLIELWLH